MNEFKKFAVGHLGMNSLALDSYMQVQSSYISPTIIEERPMNVAQMDVFSRLMMDRIIFLGTQINDYTANVIQAQLLFLDSSEPGKDISIYINSPGGSVYAGYGIYDTMQYIGCDVSTICTGMAASMGTIIASSGAKGKRFMLPNAEYMIHQPMGGTGGGTQQTDMAIVAEHLLKTRKTLEQILADNSGKSVEQIHADAERDYWMSAQETLEYGFIDEIMANNSLN